MLAEDDLVEIALLRYAQREAAGWGADRFEAEFRRRDLEERWLEAARSHTTPYGAPATDAVAAPSLPSGPVDASAQAHVVESDRDEWRLLRPTHVRHSSVPRPPAEQPEPQRRRTRRRKRERSLQERAWSISPAEASRMSAAGRRLYGLEDRSDPAKP